MHAEPFLSPAQCSPVRAWPGGEGRLLVREVVGWCGGPAVSGGIL